jgi:hypothetical protein
VFVCDHNTYYYTFFVVFVNPANVLLLYNLNCNSLPRTCNQTFDERVLLIHRPYIMYNEQ